VIVEKPVAPTVREAEQLWAIADQHGRRLVENHNYRFNRPVRHMHEIVRSGRIGDVREVEVRMCLGIRTKGMLSLSFDHRVVDGSDADKFMADVKKAIETFADGAV
jgi:hypothetical protein